MSCPDCELLYIANIPCYERGCPSTPVECRACGTVHDVGRGSSTAAMLCCAELEDSGAEDEHEHA